MLRFFVFLLWVSPCVLTKATGSTNSSCQGAECLPKTWHNVGCRTKDDCDVHHAVCYQRVCRCHPGYFYTTHDTCTNTCSTDDMQDTFTDYPDSALRANLIGSPDGLTVEDCKGRCQTNKTCLTFDFKASGGLCRLHNVTAHESPSDWSPKRSKGWTHYQKSCKSTFASNDTWYNLLCESRIDCPDTNSDCLSGRCLCRSGFNFNQDEKKCVVTSELKKWHNESCSTDDDCNQHHAVCYQQLCRCEPGYFYTTQDTCTNTCSQDDMQDSFTDYPDSALRANNLTSWDGLTVEDCKGRCQANKTCLTFDFKASGGLCRLHNVTAHESHSDWSPKRSKGWTHYQKSCNSTFASHDTWYNLLCHSKIDCPHPHSDCLSGRCLCHSGLHFNQAKKECVVTRKCADLLGTGARSGVYTVQLIMTFRPVSVWCDMDTAGGGWTVIQRRREFVLNPDEYVDFNRNWTEYVNGFGNISGDFWLGLHAIRELTRYEDNLQRLRVELVAESGTHHLAEYTFFFLSEPEDNYPLFVLGYSGDAGDALTPSYRCPFQTYDQNKYGCVTSYAGAWWHPPGCVYSADLNNPDIWYREWGNISRVTFSEMKIKPGYY